MTAPGGAKIHVVGEHQQLVLPGTLGPAGCDRGQSDPLVFAPISKKQANELLAAFGHPLGEFDRPFGFQAWGLAIDGQAVAVAVSGSTVGKRAAGFVRKEVVDLARIARHPAHPGIMRVMLRLWRDYLARRWAEEYWPVRAAVSYALPGKAGNLYRFDGWRKAGTCKPWGGGATWSNPSKANQIGDGMKTVFVYEYPPAVAGGCPGPGNS